MKWTAAGLLAGLVLLAVMLGALWRWAVSDDFRTRAQQAASQALGVPVQLGRIDLSPWPLAVALHDVQVQTRPALLFQRLEARPLWRSLLAGRPRLDALVVRQAQLPQQGIVALAAAAQRGASRSAGSPAMPQRIVLDRVTWVDQKGQQLTVDAEIAFAGEPLPQSAHIDVVAGRFRGARARLERGAGAWQLHADIGGGTVSGPLRLLPHQGGGWRLSGEFATDKVEASALTAPARALTGRIDARTTLQAEFGDPAGLADALRSQTRFTVRGAVLHGIDLAQAVRTMGASRDGRTALDTLTGRLVTQGRNVQLSQLVASSGLLSATGSVDLSPERRLNGRVVVALAAGPLGPLAGVPLQVAGTLDAPSVTPTGVALPGVAAAGSLGNRLGSGLRGLFRR